MLPSNALKREIRTMRRSICQFEIKKNQRAPPRKQPTKDDTSGLLSL